MTSPVILVAAPAASAKRECFWTHNVNSFAAVDRETANVRVGVRDVYQLKLLAPSPDIDWSLQSGIESRGSSQICSDLVATLIIPSNIGPSRYLVKLSAAEVAALPKTPRS